MINDGTSASLNAGHSPLRAYKEVGHKHMELLYGFSTVILHTTMFYLFFFNWKTEMSAKVGIMGYSYHYLSLCTYTKIFLWLQQP